MASVGTDISLSVDSLLVLSWYVKTITSHSIKIITIIYLSSVDTVYKRYSNRETLGSSFGFKISDIVPWSALWAYGMYVLGTDTYSLSVDRLYIPNYNSTEVDIYNCTHIQYNIILCKKVIV